MRATILWLGAILAGALMAYYTPVLLLAITGFTVYIFQTQDRTL